MRFTIMLNRLLRLSYPFSAEIKQAKIVECAVEFGEIIGDRPLTNHLRIFVVE